MRPTRASHPLPMRECRTLGTRRSQLLAAAKRATRYAHSVPDHGLNRLLDRPPAMHAPKSLHSLLSDALAQELASHGLRGSGAAWEAAQRALFDTLGGAPSLSLAELEAGLAAGIAAAQEAAGPGKRGGQARSSDPLISIDRALAEVQERSGDLSGQLIDDKYRLDELLAEGGFGRVYRARDLDLDCDVAIKLLKSVDGIRDAAALEAFKQEARRLTKLTHPGIVEWKTLNQTADGRIYLVMEYLEGEELASCLARERRLDASRTGRLLLQVLEALRHAHRLPDGSSLLHLDLKPSNVFLVAPEGGADERVKVLDFGISRFAGRSTDLSGPVADGGPSLASGIEPASTTRFQRQGDGPGYACTPLYCSPEFAARILGRRPAAPLDGRADLYALGVMGYAMLTGGTPFTSQGDVVALLEEHATADHVPLRIAAPKAPAGLARFVERCLRKDPDERYANADEAYAELHRLMHPRRLKRRLLAGGLALALGMAGVWKLQPEPERPPVRALIAGSAQTLANHRLYFGPQQQQHGLELVDLPDALDAATPVRLVRAPRPGAEDLPGFRVESVGGRQVRLLADMGDAVDIQRAFLEVGAPGLERYSPPFELALVPTEAWSLAQVDVPGRGGRALAARGQALQVEVSGPVDLLAGRALVRAGGREGLAERALALPGADRGRYELDLDEWAGISGATTFAVEISDVAGGTQTRAVTVDLVAEPLRLKQSRVLGAAQSLGRWLLVDGEPVQLEVEANRACALSWSVKATGGRELAKGGEALAVGTHTIDLGNAGWGGGALDGRLLLSLEESEHVLHATGSTWGRTRREFELQVQAVGARFDFSLTGAKPWTVGDPPVVQHYLGEDAGPLVVFRDHDTPMAVEVALVQGAEQIEVLEVLRFASQSEQRKSLQLPALKDGVALLRLTASRLDGQGALLDRVDQVRELVLVQDTSGPEVALAAWEAAPVLRSKQDLIGLVLRFEASDDATVSQPAPRCHWSLRAARSGGWEASGSLVMAAAPVTRTVAQLLGGKTAPEIDGDYELTLHAEDFAGNAGASRTYDLTLSAKGPVLRVTLPSDGAAWSQIHRRFRIELSAADPNGTAKVNGVLIDALGELDPVDFALNPVAGEAGADSAESTLWAADLALDHRWSERSVRLRIVGMDSEGTSSLEPVELQCRLASIASVVPNRLAVQFRGRGEAPMHRVAGNTHADYVFGGRGDRIENADFLRTGLPAFGSRIREDSLQVNVPAGAITDYYVDVSEVTVKQYRAFLEDPASVEALGTERHRVLQDLVATAGAALPMTGVRHREARAYARWAGKELPTYLHWEYAVRGPGYRPFAHDSGDSAGSGASVQEINVNGAGPWPVNQGRDLTPDAGLRNLCSNVAEWTRTGADQQLSQLTPTQLLNPSPEGTRFIAAGGSFDRRFFHFGVIRRQSAEQPSASIGFRCMLPAALVDAAFLRGMSEHEEASDLVVRRLP